MTAILLLTLAALAFSVFLNFEQREALRGLRADMDALLNDLMEVEGASAGEQSPHRRATRDDEGRAYMRDESRSP